MMSSSGLFFLHLLKNIEFTELVVQFPVKEYYHPTGQPTWNGSPQAPGILPERIL